MFLLVMFLFISIGNQPDHVSRHCPKPKKVLSCVMCGFPGHKSQTCPNSCCLGVSFALFITKRFSLLIELIICSVEDRVKALHKIVPSALKIKVPAVVSVSSVTSLTNAPTCGADTIQLSQAKSCQMKRLLQLSRLNISFAPIVLVIYNF